MQELTPLQKLMLETVAAADIPSTLYRFFDVESFSELKGLHRLGLIELRDDPVRYSLTAEGQKALGGVIEKQADPAPESDLLRAIDDMLRAAAVVRNNHGDTIVGFEAFFLAHLKPDAALAVQILEHLGLIQIRGGYVSVPLPQPSTDSF